MTNRRWLSVLLPLLVAACATQENGRRTDAAVTLARAVERTRGAASIKFSYVTAVRFDAQPPVVLTGIGYFNRAGDSDLTERVHGGQYGSKEDVEVRTLRRAGHWVFYFRPLSGVGLPAGKRWIRVNSPPKLRANRPATRKRQVSGAANDPYSALALIANAETALVLPSVGTSGHAVTRYLISRTRFLREPTEVWVDERGYVIRMDDQAALRNVGEVDRFSTTFGFEPRSTRRRIAAPPSRLVVTQKVSGR